MTSDNLHQFLSREYITAILRCCDVPATRNDILSLFWRTNSYAQLIRPRHGIEILIRTRSIVKKQMDPCYPWRKLTTKVGEIRHSVISIFRSVFIFWLVKHGLLYQTRHGLA